MDTGVPKPSGTTIAPDDPTVPAGDGYRTASEVLREIAVVPDDALDTVSIGEIVAAFGERSFGLVILLFAMANTIPGPPGLSSLVGIPFLLIAMQMTFGYATPWLPHTILRREYRRSDLTRLIERAQPVLRRLERFSRPRLHVLFRIMSPRVLGVFLSLLALCVMIPLPLTNSLPSFAAIIVAIAIIGADGLLLLVGIAAGLAAIAVTAVISGAAVGLVLMGLRALFGA